METPHPHSDPDEMPDLLDQAVTYTWPLYEMRRARASTSYGTLPDAGAAPEGMRWANVFAHRRDLLRPGVSKIVTPNNDTLYSVAWLDLGAGPLVIDVPDMHGRYHVLGLLDHMTNPFAHVGTRLHGAGPTSVLVSGPDWEGETPDAYRSRNAHLRAGTRWAWVIGRILVSGEEDLPAVRRLQDGLRIRSLDASRTATVAFDPGCDPDEPLGAAHFALQVNAALKDCAGSAALDWNLIRSFGVLGIGAGLRTTSAQLAALERAIHRVRRLLQVPKAVRSSTQWAHFPTIDSAHGFGGDDLLRAHVALQYIGMVESREAVYPMTWHDASGERLNGERDYVLHFEGGRLPPVDAFWSLTLYESRTCMLVPNEIERYAIGDRTPGLLRDADGGLRIFIGHQRPEAEAAANWLPAPSTPFHLCLRAYLPRSSILDGRYELPAVHLRQRT